MRPLLALLWLLLLPGPGFAVVHDLPDPNANTTPPPDDPGFANVGNAGGLTAVYLGGGWVLTAAHVALGPVVFEGTSYPPLPSSKALLTAEAGATLPPDLAVWRLNPPWPKLPTLPIQEDPLSMGDPIVMIGNGASRTGTSTCNTLPAYTWGGTHSVRWGTNHVEGFELVAIPQPTPTRETQSIASYFDCDCDGTGGTEAMAANGDSGGGVFFKDGGTWRLAGIMFAVQRCANGVATRGNGALQLGDATFSADLSVYRSQILALTPRPIPALPLWGPPLLGGLLGGAGVRELRRRS